MRKRTAMRGLLCLSVSLSLGACATVNAVHEAPWGERGYVGDGGARVDVRARAEIFNHADGAPVRIGMHEPIHLVYRIKNIGVEAFVVWRCGFWCNHRVLLENATGVAAPLRALGVEVGKEFGGTRVHNYQTRIRPGDTFNDRVDADLMDIYGPLLPGEYRLRIIYDDHMFGEHVRIESSVVRFTLQPDR